ncbi:MAG: FkbM family methyltransferase [Bacteroidota bacterium]
MGFISGIGRKLFPSESMRLIRNAGKFPRFQHTKFSYRDLELEVTDFLSVAWQLMEIFEEEELRFNSSAVNPLIYDCGANVGISSLYFKKLFPGAVVKAFEPDPDVFKCLEKNVSRNHIHGIELFQKAIWTENGRLTFSSEGADGGSLVSGSGKKIEVESVRLKDLLGKEKEVDLLKIDIEGAEVDVINDIREELNKVKLLFVEYHSRPGQPQRLDELCHSISSAGFRYYIRSINSSVKNPFVSEMGVSGMDIQLNIHAIR